jgi:two-component system sensor histidine kinase KdpD
MAEERERAADERPTAEEMLERIRRQAGADARGRLRIYLGMAPGVGKTYAALQEMHRRKERGTDAVLGFVETYNRPKTIEAIGDLELIPRKKILYKGITLEELDTAAVIRRHPAVVLVDELAHTNAPGSERAKRWQDVEELLSNGITVITTLNIQHLESLSDIIESITGAPVRERIPDRVVDQADEIELVDMSPHALRQRMRHGNVYPPAEAERALHQFFREGNLSALRELALRKVATAVETDLERYMRQHKIEAVWPAGERVMVALTARPEARMLLRRGWRMADSLETQLIAVFVETPEWTNASPEALRQLGENLRYAEELGAEVVRVRANDVASAIMQIARDKNVGSIVIGHSSHGRFHELVHGSIVGELLRVARDVDVHVVATRAA